MDKLISDLIARSTTRKQHTGPFGLQQVEEHFDKEKFAKLLVEETLKQVDERCYGRGENQWYYEDDKKWIRLHFFGGKL
jgi:hypothetical protein